MNIKLIGTHRPYQQLFGACGNINDKKAANKSIRKCMRHRHELVDNSSMNEMCFSKIPILQCGSTCHSVGQREKRVSFTW